MDKALICRRCGKLVEKRGPAQKYCRECSGTVISIRGKMRKRKVAEGRNHAAITPVDTPEMIKTCLSCKKAACTNCFEHKTRQNIAG